MRSLLLMMGIWVGLISCTNPSDDQIKRIEGACQGLTADEVKKIDDISESCKAAIAELLPSPSNNLSSRLFKLSSDSSTDKHKLVLAGTDTLRAAISAEELKGIELSAVIAGLEQKIPASGYTISKALGDHPDLLSIALVGDYSGSMGDADITLVSELFADFTQYLTPLANFEVIHFSSEVAVNQTFTADSNLLQSALQKNTSIPRTSTALYDAVGKAAEDLAASTRLGHVLVVGTDGMENASSKYTIETLKAALKADKRLLVVIMGTFLSDVSEMQELAGDSGIFAYAQSVKDGQKAVLSFSKALRESVVIELSELYKDVPQIKASFGSSSVTVSF